MLSIRTAKGFTVPVLWIGVSDIDNSLRFETQETNIATLFSVFSDPSHTAILTRIFDGNEREYAGFTQFKGMELMTDKTKTDRTTVVRLLPRKPVED